MSNPLSVRRVRVQTIDEDGNDVGRPSFGVLAADGYAQSYNDSYETREDLESAIKTAPSILQVADECGEMFPDPDHAKIGRKNFYGKEWGR